MCVCTYLRLSKDNVNTFKNTTNTNWEIIHDILHANICKDGWGIVWMTSSRCCGVLWWWWPWSSGHHMRHMSWSVWAEWAQLWVSGVRVKTETRESTWNIFQCDTVILSFCWRVKDQFDLIKFFAGMWLKCIKTAWEEVSDIRGKHLQ